MIDFFKMSGSGNDFILIDNRQGSLAVGNVVEFVKSVCERKVSVGADGLIIIEPSDRVDFRWRFFNADGSEVEMCGNGGRCAARFAYLMGIAGEKMSFETGAGIIDAEVRGDFVKLRLTDPQNLVMDDKILAVCHTTLLISKDPSAHAAMNAIREAARKVGGDYYDFIKPSRKPHSLVLLIADITDKGLPAAQMLANARAILRSEALNGRRPLLALRRTNQWLEQDRLSGVFMTAFFAMLDTRSGELTYASGGHDWPLWVQAASGECRELETHGMILGAFRDVQLEERQILLAPGDLLVCYTDGVTDMTNAAGERFGAERLQKTVAAHARSGATQMLDAIVSATKEFGGEMSQADDFTLFVVKREAAETEEKTPGG